MPTWKLIIEYDGTDLCGWQRQINGPTVQEHVEAGLRKLHSGDEVKVMAAGRTDAGVHARGQVISFTTPRELKLNSYQRGLNTYMPLTIAARHAEIVPDGFDARRWARGKRYEYRILRSRYRSPLRDRFTWQVHQSLDLEEMRRAAEMLLGRHDFGSFRASNCDAKTTVREITRIQITEVGAEVLLVFEATAFLKHMVRNLVGTLVEVARGKRDARTIPELLATPDRPSAGPTAPPQGLCLDEVFYDMAKGPPHREILTDADE